MDMATSTPSSCTCIQLKSCQIQPRCVHLKPLCAARLCEAQILKWAPGSCKRGCVLRAQSVESSAAGASTDSVVAQVSMLDESKASTTDLNGRRPSPLSSGGTLTGDKASGKDPGLSALGKEPARVGSNDGAFQDVRWKAGTWDLQQFTAHNGKVDWDAVIDAEVRRRKWLEDNPEASWNEDPVVFATSAIPWWAWMRRFHLPEAEILNGRAAMIGFFMGYVVDGLTGAGLVDQMGSFVGKLLLLVCVLGVLFIRKNKDVQNLKQLSQEWNFYDKQWQASWQDEHIPSLKRKE